MKKIYELRKQNYEFRSTLLNSPILGVETRKLKRFSEFIRKYMNHKIPFETIYVRRKIQFLYEENNK